MTIAAPTTVPRLLPVPPATGLADHVARFGPLPSAGHALLEEIRRAGLRGRGGASFPTAIKMAAVARGSHPVVVVNGTEGEPLSRKDKILLTRSPHLVLDGACAAADALGAADIVVCIERSAVRVIEVTRAAVAERYRPGAPAIRLAATPERYLTGEESALVHWLNGGEAKPTFVPPRPFERGVGGAPTLVANVETLAHVGLIARYGASWFRSAGTDDDPGTALVTVSGVARPDIYEIEFGTLLTEVLASAGAGPGDVQAVLVGGYFGTWVAGTDVAGLRLAPRDLAAAGAGFGCGAVFVLPPGSCGLIESARVARWLAGQNAGQCGPCVVGLPAIADALDHVVAGDGDGSALAAIGRWSAMVAGRGACKHPDGTVRFIDSSLRTFADEIERHRRYGPCPSVPPIVPLPEAGAWR